MLSRRQEEKLIGELGEFLDWMIYDEDHFTFDANIGWMVITAEKLYWLVITNVNQICGALVYFMMTEK